MKAIIISIKPKFCAKIMNGDKTIEVRKLFPKKYVGWVYIYCTKGKPYLWKGGYRPMHTVDTHNPFNYYWHLYSKDSTLNGGFNGKVVARFWCYKMEEITTEKWSPSKEQDLLKASCLTENQLFDYCNLESGKPFYAIHISKLEIFDEPKELSEFKYWKDKSEYGCWYENKLTKAPQNMVYIEVTENE